MGGTTVAELAVLGHSESVYRLVLVKLIDYVYTETSCVRTFLPFLETISLFLQKVLSFSEELHESCLLVDLYSKDRAFQGYRRCVF